MKNDDIFIIENNLQNTILIGEMDLENNQYNIKYILEFNSKINFINERDIISESDINNYIKSKMVFNHNNPNDYISPIFSLNKIIGYCYKYISNINYLSCNNYYNLFSNEIFKKSIKLYNYYQKIEKKIKGINTTI